MPKSSLRLAPEDDYAPVADRIILFYEAFPTGRIITELISSSDRRMIVKAAVFRGALDTLPAATGLASERENDGEVNAVACLENTETSAIGRALANLGFTASRQRPSAEEMAKAARARAARNRTGAQDPIKPSPPRRDRVNEPLQEYANTVTDILGLLKRAERMGLKGDKLESLRARILKGGAAPSALTRLERILAGWIEERERGMSRV